MAFSRCNAGIPACISFGVNQRSCSQDGCATFSDGLLDKACSKRSALEVLIKDYGFLPEETMAIGDNHNDLEMLEYAGIGVIMANCVEELKGRGFIETLSNNDLGVTRALERFVL